MWPFRKSTTYVPLPEDYYYSKAEPYLTYIEKYVELYKINMNSIYRNGDDAARASKRARKCLERLAELAGVKEKEDEQA